ncbi:hypothetical protein [Streptomyces sp. TR06-5]|uniref:hypothetical protein n=1 Tax=unclassified Streptomyces TaxID=2593676 RepID=UPI0039A0DE36
MQRRARTRLAGAAVTLAVAGGLTACTGVSGEQGTDTGTDVSAAARPAAPGRFRTLPEPCGAVSRGTLATMLPGAAARAEEAERDDDVTDSGTPSPLEGEAALTYDTDRRVSCTWQSTTSLGSRELTVDFERIVSYDPEVSDDAAAENLFTDQARDAGAMPEPAASDATASPSGAGNVTAPDAAAGEESGPRSVADVQGDTASPSPSDDGTTPDGDGTDPASPSAEPSLQPRTLEDIGDTAFIDDRLDSSPVGSGSLRGITLVFRTSNVLVTVEYSQSLADARRTPDSAELQDHTQNLARQLAEQFSDS